MRFNSKSELEYINRFKVKLVFLIFKSNYFLKLMRTKISRDIQNFTRSLKKVRPDIREFIGVDN